MIRYYCDGCGSEAVNTARVTFTPHKKDRLPAFEIITGAVNEEEGGSWNGGIWCPSCLLRAVLRAFAVLGVTP